MINVGEQRVASYVVINLGWTSLLVVMPGYCS